MKPTFEQHNDFLAHRPLTGVSYEHDEYVQIIGGEHKGEKGNIVSVEELGADPVFLIELESGRDVQVTQSHIEAA